MKDMFGMQKSMQEETYGHNFDGMTDVERIEFITWNILALSDELHEALAEIGWKPWSTSRHINEDAFKGELVDAFHFFMNLCIAVGMDVDELEKRYVLKRELNIKRQTDGYDGVQSKCPACKRATDDAAVGVTRESRKFVRCGSCGERFIRWAIVDARYSAFASIEGDVDVATLKTRLEKSGLTEVVVYVHGDTGKSKAVHILCRYNVRGNWNHDIEDKISTAMKEQGVDANVHSTVVGDIDIDWAS